MSYRTIIVGTDGSASSFRAVDRAAALAAQVNAKLIIASAHLDTSEKGGWSRAPSPDRLLDGRAADSLGGASYRMHGRSSTPSDRRERQRYLARSFGWAFSVVELPGFEPAAENAVTCGDAGSDYAKARETTCGYARGVDGVNKPPPPGRYSDPHDTKVIERSTVPTRCLYQGF